MIFNYFDQIGRSGIGTAILMIFLMLKEIVKNIFIPLL